MPRLAFLLSSPTRVYKEQTAFSHTSSLRRYPLQDLLSKSKDSRVPTFEGKKIPSFGGYTDHIWILRLILARLRALATRSDCFDGEHK